MPITRPYHIYLDRNGSKLHTPTVLGDLTLRTVYVSRTTASHYDGEAFATLKGPTFFFDKSRRSRMKHLHYIDEVSHTFAPATATAIRASKGRGVLTVRSPMLEQKALPCC